MTKYVVVKPFHDLTGFLSAGDTIELDSQSMRAEVLQNNGVVVPLQEETIPARFISQEESFSVLLPKVEVTEVKEEVVIPEVITVTNLVDGKEIEVLQSDVDDAELIEPPLEEQSTNNTPYKYNMRKGK